MRSEAAYFPDALATAAELRDAARSAPEPPADPLDDAPEEPASGPGRIGEVSDELLLAQVRAGAKDAFGLLFRRYARLVRTVAQRILRDPSEAEDLLQEVFLFVFRRAALFDPQRGSARSWLVQVTWHRAIDRRRYLMARHFYTNLELEEAVVGGGEHGTEARSYERTMEGALGKEALRRIDESLSEDQRRVLRLHFFEGHTLAEIAALLAQTPGNVRNHYYRALEKMRAQVFREKLQRK